MINKKWEKKKIEDIFKETYEKNQPNSDVLTIIQGRGTVLREASGREIIYDKNSLSNYKHVQKNDFIIHLRSFEGGLEIANQDGIVSPAYITLHPKIKIEPGYLYALFHSNQFINQTMAPAVEGARDGRSVKYEVLKKQSIAFPPLPEQRKIAEILTAQDRVITLKEKLVAEKRKQKKFLMNQLLSCENEKKITINDIKIDKTKWIFKTIGDVCSTFSGGTPNRSHSEYFNGSIPWIKSGELNKENIYQTEEFLTQKGIENSSTKIVKKGTLLIAMYGATAGILAFTHIDAAINQAILALVPKIEINLFYLKYALENKIDIAVHKYVQGGQPNFNATIIESFKIEFPTLPEQQAIAEVLSAADREISLLQQNLEQERKKKKSLMQLLLSGLVRVNAPEDSHEL